MMYHIITIRNSHEEVIVVVQPATWYSYKQLKILQTF